MKNKFLLSAGTIAAAAVPVITVISCGETSPLDKQLDKIQNTTATKSAGDINTAMSSLTAADGKLTLDAAAVTAIGLDHLKVDEGYTVVYTFALVGEATGWTDLATTGDTNPTFALTATVSKDDESKSKDITVTADITPPTITADKVTPVLGGMIVEGESNNTLALTSSTTADIAATKTAIEGLFSVSDDLDSALATPTFNWTTDLTALTDGSTAVLTVDISDNVGNAATQYTLNISVADAA